MEEKKDRKKEKTYICKVCGKSKKKEQGEQDVECCGQEMTSEEKGTWNA